MRLGLNGIKAAGTDYQWDMFAPKLRAKLEALKAPEDGEPASLTHMLRKMGQGLPGAPSPIQRLKPCGAGIGTKGGKSRGVGSGSRLKLYQCGCGRKIRAAGPTLESHARYLPNRFRLSIRPERY